MYPYLTFDLSGNMLIDSQFALFYDIILIIFLVVDIRILA